VNSPIVPQERAYTLSTKQGWNAYVNAAERKRPEPMTRAQLNAISQRARMDYEEHRAVWHANLGPLRTPQMRAVHEDLDDIVEANRQDGDKVKGAAVIDAFPGLGKSTIAQTFARDFHTRQVSLYGPMTEAGHERIPVVHVCLTSSTSKRSFNAMLCRFFNLPGSGRGTAEHLGHKAADAVLACAVRLIVVDDVHFLDPRRRDGRDVANHFKYLANTFPVTFIFVGVGIARRGLISEGLGAGDEELAQNGRRWTTLGVAPFEIETEPGRRTWRRLLLAIERDLVLANTFPGMVADELSDYLFARSTGHFASLMTLVARGCRRAIRIGDERLTREVLDQVKNDAAAETARQELLAAFEHRRLRSRPTPSPATSGAPSVLPAAG
jgi:AAA domain